MPKYYHPDTDFFVKRNLPAPTAVPHGFDEDIREKLKAQKPTEWRLEGNKLIGKTEMGDVAQYIGTDYILKGTDENGLPILEKIVL